MYTVTELGIFDIIAKEEGEVANYIAAQLPSKNSEAGTMIDRILGLPACHSVIDCTLLADQHASPSQLKRLYCRQIFYFLSRCWLSRPLHNVGS